MLGLLYIRLVIDALFKIAGLPKELLQTETWLTTNSPLLNIDNYHFLSSPRVCDSGGGVAMYVHNSLQYIVKDRSCDHPISTNIDYLLVELTKINITLCCIYYPSRTKLNDINRTLEQLKTNSCAQSKLIIGGDYNINLLDSNSDTSLEFIDNVHSLSLHPVTSLPTRVADTSSTLIDNFLCDISLLPIHTNVLKTDASDHYLIELKIDTPIPNKNVSKCNYSNKNKIKFTNNICMTSWDTLYKFSDVNLAFNYFIKKFNRIYNKSFPYIPIKQGTKKNPWLTAGILKSIRHKNILFLKAKTDPAYRNEFKK